MTTAAMAAGVPEKFQIGRVFGRTFSVIARNPVVYVGLAVVVSGLPAFLYMLLSEQLTVTTTMSDGRFTMGSSYQGWGVLYLVVSFALGNLLQAALVRATIEDLNGKRPRAGECVRTAGSVLLPVLGIAVLGTLGVALGCVLLFVPGIILLLMWCVAVPVAVHERRGVLASMGRSRQLVKGSKWRLFWLFAILIVAFIALEIVLGIMVDLATGFFGIALLSTVVSTAFAVIWAAAIAAAYVELRTIKEGTSVEELAAIFA